MPAIIFSLVAFAALGIGSAATAEPWCICGWGNCVPSPAPIPGSAVEQDATQAAMAQERTFLEKSSWAR
jgi:hypothetical protein